MKPDYRKRQPRPAGSAEFRTLMELRRWLDSAGYIVDAKLGDLAYLDVIEAAQIGDGAVGTTQLAPIASARLLGRTTAGTGTVEALTAAQATALLDAFTDVLKGLVPASGGGTDNFLRADGAWSPPPNPVTTRRLTADHSIASTTATVVSDLTVPLVAGTYAFQYFLICQSTATGTGLALGVNYTGTMTRFSVARRYFTTGGTAANGVMVSQIATLTGNLVEHNTARLLSSTAPNLGPNTGVVGANTDCLNVVEGVIAVSDAGDLELWHRSENAVATSVEVESSLVLTRIA